MFSAVPICLFTGVLASEVDATSRTATSHLLISYLTQQSTTKRVFVAGPDIKRDLFAKFFVTEASCAVKKLVQVYHVPVERSGDAGITVA